MSSLIKRVVYKQKYIQAVWIILLFLVTPSWATEDQQYIYATPTEVNKSIGSQWDVTFTYDVSTGDNTLVGIGFRVHYDSTKLEFIESKNIETDNFMNGGYLIESVEETPRHRDSDDSTDRYIVVAWASYFNLTFPNKPLPLKLFDATFRVKSSIPESNTSLNLVVTSHDKNYDVIKNNPVIHITSLPTANWSVSSQTISESIGEIDITAGLNFTSATNVVIPYTVTGSSTSSIDYDAFGNSITISSGQLTATKTITIINDSLIEPDETIIITMGEPTSGALIDIPRSVQTITIENDDYGRYTDTINPTGYTVTFQGNSFTINNQLADIGDEIGVFDPDGVLCGRVVLNEAGIYTLTVYGDDPATTEVDEGAAVNDPLIFKVWDLSSQSELVLTEDMFISASVNGNLASSIPPVWTGNSDSWGLNINMTMNQEIPLRAGWNLFSFSVKKVYYTSSTPPVVNTFADAIYEKVETLNDVLSSISGKYQYIRSADVKFYGPEFSQEINNLTYLAAGHGYWIYMYSDETLLLNGPMANPSDSISLNSGWNLVGCWHSKVQYVTEIIPLELFPEDIQYLKVDSLKKIFSSIDGSYSIIRNYKAEDYIADELSTIKDVKYIGPGYGYWIYITEPSNFHY